MDNIRHFTTTAHPLSLAPTLHPHALAYALIESVISHVSAATNKYIDSYIGKGGGGSGGDDGVSTFPSPLPSSRLWPMERTPSFRTSEALSANFPSLCTAPDDMNTMLCIPIDIHILCRLISLLFTALRRSVGCHSGSEPPGCNASLVRHDIPKAMLSRFISPALHSTSSLCRV